MLNSILGLTRDVATVYPSGQRPNLSIQELITNGNNSTTR